MELFLFQVSANQEHKIYNSFTILLDTPQNSDWRCSIKLKWGDFGWIFFEKCLKFLVSIKLFL